MDTIRLIIGVGIACDLAERWMGAIMAEQALGSIKSTYKDDMHPIMQPRTDLWKI